MRVLYGEPNDLSAWMRLVRSVAWNFPGLETEESLLEHEATVRKFMGKQQAICVKDNGGIAAVLLFSRGHNMICCLAVDPAHRRQGLASLLLTEALSRLDRTRPVTVSTFCEGDVRGTAPRALYKKFGFLEGAFREEFGCLNQVFVLPPVNPAYEAWKLPMTEQIEAMRAGTLRVEDLTKVYLARLEQYGGRDGLTVLAQANPNALEEARALDQSTDRSGALFGLPILVKDNIDVRGLYTTAGSMTLQDNLAEKDAPVIANLRKAGAVILGKANMTEFANYTASAMPNGFSSFGGQVVHAYDPARDPSGSSTGSGVAVSAGLCAAAIGTDTSFSIVGCAARNGVTGLKPAYGALSGAGIVPIACLLDSAGPITRTLEDAVRIGEVMREAPLGPIPATPPAQLRLAVNTFNREKVAEAQLGLYDKVLNRLREAGAQITETEHPYQPRQRDLMRCAFRADLEGYLAGRAIRNDTLAGILADFAAHPDWMPYGVDVLQAAMEADKTDPAYGEALQARERVREAMQTVFEDFDACLMTGPTNSMHFCGFPSVALRLGMDAQGMPQGMILYGADERRLLSAALCIERFAGPVDWPAGIMK